MRNIKKLKTIQLPKTVHSIGQNAFKYCDSLRDKDGFIIINDFLISYLGNDKEIFIPQGIREITGMALLDYRNSKLKVIHIPDTVTTIGRLAIEPGMTIWGKPGSVAEEYANNNSCIFKAE